MLEVRAERIYNGASLPGERARGPSTGSDSKTETDSVVISGSGVLNLLAAGSTSDV